MTPNDAKPGGFLTKTHTTSTGEERHVSVLYQGPEKTWKSTLAQSWPDPHIFYFEQNQAVLHRRAGLRYSIPEDWGASWDGLKNQVLPAITNRRVEAKTIVFDATTSMCELLYAKIRKDSGKDEFAQDEYGRILAHLGAFWGPVTRVTTPFRDHPGYHLVVIAHEKEWYRRGRGKQPEIDRIRPNIEGAYKDILPTKFDSVFLTRSKRTKNDAGDFVQKSSILTAPPNELYFCGDGVGNVEGQPPLPVELAGDFQTLAGEWETRGVKVAR